MWVKNREVGKEVKTYLCGGSTKRSDDASCGKGCFLSRKIKKRAASGDNQLLHLFNACNSASNQLCCHQAVTSSRVLYPRFSPANCTFINNSFFLAHQPHSGTDRFIIQVSRSHTNTCTAARTPLHE